MTSSKISMAIISVLILALYGAVGTGAVDPGQTRGSFATHDAGNFTVNIGDDGGATGWDTLEFPPGEDRLDNAYFGIGSSSDKVDFGGNDEFETIKKINISSPGNHTEEEGFCSFSGWSGEDFDDHLITQRTYVNGYRENTRGHTGRWMVIDYLIEAPSASESDLFFLQTMNIDLGASASDDSFSFISEINTTAISQENTFVGLGYFSFSDDSRYFGHNGGEYGPSVYSTESSVFHQMHSPNNMTTSGTRQDWYMDISARVPSSETSDPFHVSFIVMVGTDHHALKEAYHDAKNALTGEWEGPDPNGWKSGDIPMEFHYEGPVFPPLGMEMDISMIEPDRTLVTPTIVSETNNVTYTADTEEGITDHGILQWSVTSYSPFGFKDMGHSGSVSIDNMGPTTSMWYVNDDPTGTLKILTNADDRGGSGIARTEMSMDGEHFVEASQLEIFDDGTGYDLYSRSVDNAGNRGPTVSLTDLINDGTSPAIENLVTEPINITDKTDPALRVSFQSFDDTSGLNRSSARMRYSISDGGSSPGEWMSMENQGSTFYLDVEEEFGNLSGKTLSVNARISDMLGNEREASLTEFIDPVNDPPSFRLSLVDPSAVSNLIALELEGNDPEGDDVNFSFEYHLNDDVAREVPASNMNWTDGRHLIIEAPDTDYEGPITITGTATDGDLGSPLNEVTATMDRKAPVIGVSNLPEQGRWIRSPGVYDITATDGASQVFSVWYLEDDGIDVELVNSNRISVEDEGIFEITAFAQDNAGNTGQMSVGTIRCDLNPPVINGISMEPDDPVQGDDLEVVFHVTDSLGFHHPTVSSDPSSFMEVKIRKGETEITADTITAGSGPGNYTAGFIDPFPSTGDGWMLHVTASDEAGNEGEGQYGPFEVSGDIEKMYPFRLDYPVSVDAGDSYTITMEHDGPVILDMSYPDTSMSWVISPERTEGNVRTYSLPACFLNGDMEFIILYGEEGSDNLSLETDPFLIEVRGAVDTDGDGLSDQYENSYDLDPNKRNTISSDSDDDGLDMMAEMIHLTDPDEYDTDGDGMDDGWEARYGTLPFREDHLEDPDDDDWSNHREYDADTDPRDPADHPQYPPATPWYWVLLIVLALLSIIAYFVVQLFRRRRLEDDLDALDEEMKWDDDNR